jgi:6-pyruvoyltetrahydropterin/6-carboxytetrahydropterin synthase
VFEITVTAHELDDVGRVIDFSAIKELVGAWLEANWDHAFIYELGDPIGDFLQIHKEKSFSMHVPPTAENLANFVLSLSQQLLPFEIKVLSVKCHETATCYAEATL